MRSDKLRPEGRIRTTLPTPYNKPCPETLKSLGLIKTYHSTTKTMGPRKLTVTIYRDVNVTGVYPWSPFVAKLETRLRFSLLPYSVQGGSLSDSPKSKLPYARIEDEKEGASSVICDSTLITRTLIELGLIEDLNVDLSPTPKAMDLALRALLEDKLYFITVSFISI